MSFLEDKQEHAFNEEAFSEMLERSLQTASFLTPGEKIIAQIVSITSENIFINLGSKKEGFICTSELVDENNKMTVKVGDHIEAFFDRVEDGLMRFTTLINGIPATTLNYLKEVANTGVSIEGRVERQNKGGFEVMIRGVRAFCPVSQIDLKPAYDKSIYEGKTFSFKIIEFKEDAKGIVVSRKVLLEEQKKAKIEALKDKIKEGAILEGVVRSVKSFGIFVDIDGIQALIPSSEISWTRVQNLESLFNEGQIVKAVVLSADLDAEKITMSIKSLYEDPWVKIEEKYPVGTKVSGSVSKLMPFGAFVNIEDGIEGLIHISNLNTGRRLKHPNEILSTGQVVEAYVLSIDKENKKLALTLKSPERLEIVYPNIGEIIPVTISRIMPFGMLAKINDGLTGLIPNSELALYKGEDVKLVYKEGSVINVIVQDVDKENIRVRLSIKEYLQKKETEEYRQFMEQQHTNTDKSMGSLGELLQMKLEQRITNNKGKV